jgi:hypothetical protein
MYNAGHAAPVRTPSPARVRRASPPRPSAQCSYDNSNSRFLSSQHPYIFNRPLSPPQLARNFSPTNCYYNISPPRRRKNSPGKYQCNSFYVNGKTNEIPMSKKSLRKKNKKKSSKVINSISLTSKPTIIQSERPDIAKTDNNNIGEVVLETEGDNIHTIDNYSANGDDAYDLDKVLFSDSFSTDNRNSLTPNFYYEYINKIDEVKKLKLQRKKEGINSVKLNIQNKDNMRYKQKGIESLKLKNNIIPNGKKKNVLLVKEALEIEREKLTQKRLERELELEKEREKLYQLEMMRLKELENLREKIRREELEDEEVFFFFFFYFI